MTTKSDKRKLNIFQCQCLTGRMRIRWQQRMTNTTSFPGSTPLSRGRLRAEKTLAHTVRSPAKYSTNGGIFCHVTYNGISSSLHLISGCRNQKWLKMCEDLALMWLHFACFRCKIVVVVVFFFGGGVGVGGGPLNFQIHLSWFLPP